MDIRCVSNQNVVTAVTPVEAGAWNSFDNVVHNFLGKMKSESYREVVEELLSSACKNSRVG